MSPILGIFASQGRVASTSFDSIATVNVGAGGASSISFTSIPSTYKHLQIRCLARGTNATNSVELFITYNGSTSTYYRGHQLYGEGATAYASANNDATSGYAAYITGSTNTANVFAGAVIDVLDYTNTNKYKVSKTLTGYDANGSGIVLLRSSLWQTTSAVTQIDLVTSGGNLAQYSSFALYGIKG